jgi:hypothetical protein
MAVSAKLNAHADHASQEALCPLTLPTLDVLSLPLASQHHSTVRSPAMCYENRYEAHFLSRVSRIFDYSPMTGISDVCLYP